MLRWSGRSAFYIYFNQNRPWANGTICVGGAHCANACSLFRADLEKMPQYWKRIQVTVTTATSSGNHATRHVHSFVLFSRRYKVSNQFHFLCVFRPRHHNCKTWRPHACMWVKFRERLVIPRECNVTQKPNAFSPRLISTPMTRRPIVLEILRNIIFVCFLPLFNLPCFGLLVCVFVFRLSCSVHNSNDKGLQVTFSATSL